MEMTRKLMVAALALAGATNVMAAGDTPQSQFRDVGKEMKTRCLLPTVIGFCSICACAHAAQALSTSNDGAKAVKKARALADFPVECARVASVEGREAVSETEAFILLTTEAKWCRKTA